jgi:predicted permease
MVKHAFRRLAKSPVSTAIALVTLALGIGVNTVVFSIMDAFLLRALPYPHPDRIAAIVVHREDTNRAGRTVSEEDDSFDGASWRLLKASLDGVTLASSGWGGSGGVNLRAGTVVRYLTGARVSARYFEVLGIPFLFGRSFSEDEDRPYGPPVVVLSYALWQSTFHSDPGIIGKSIELKGEPYTVVGILARNALTPSHASLFTPLQPAETGECAGTNCGILARLKPGATWTQIDAQLSRIRLPYFTELETKYHGRARIYARPLQVELAGDMRGKVIVLMLAVSFILLIACANLAGLGLVRILRRGREISTRFALGASRLDVICELWMEDVLVALFGGAAGVGLALLVLNSARRLLPVSMLPLVDFSIDARVLAFTFGAALLTSLIFGALPALEIRRFDVGSVSFAGSRAVTSGSSRLRQMLIGGEVALTVVLLASAGLLVRTLLYLETLPPGFDSHDVMTAQASLDDARYHEAVAFQKLVEKSVAAMRQIPGVRDAAVGLSVPYERGLNNLVTIQDGKAAGTKAASSVAYVTPGYFSTLRIPLQAGRFITFIDGPASDRVATVNVAFGRRFFNNPAPIGYHFNTANTTYTIVGVVGNVVKQQGIQPTAPIGTEPVAYLPVSQTPQDLINIAHIWFQPSWIVRTQGPIRGLNAAMQRALADADPNLPFSGFHSMQQILSDQLQQQRVAVLLLAAMASLALLLSAVGIYALVSNLVVQRTREIGIRMALGSTSARAILQVGAPGILAAAGGLAAGMALTLLTMRVISSQIYGISAYDPVTFIAVPLILVLTAGAASFLPALRISRIQPSDALRVE